MLNFVVRELSLLIQRHPGIVGVAIIAGLLIMLIRSVIRALQRWEIIPDPLLPAKWRKRINAVEMAALEASADDRTYNAIAGGLSGGGCLSRKSGSFSGGGGKFGGFLIFAAGWKIFVKAGQPGWAALIPIYNLIVLVQIVGRPVWFAILMLIPFVGLIPGFILAFDLAKVFGKGAGFALGMIFLAPIFAPMLAWGNAKYQGVPAAA